MNIFEDIAGIIKIFISGAIFFVWVIRYKNIVKEFTEFNYPDWLRDFVGVLKICFAIMLLKPEQHFALVASVGISILMSAALLTHLKVKNPLYKMLPSFTLLCFSLFILKDFL